MLRCSSASARITAAVLAVAALCAGLAAAAAVAVACGEEPGAPAGPAVGVAPVPANPAVLYEVWHVYDAHLYRVHRDGAGGYPSPLARVLRELMDGPWSEEKAFGLWSEVTPYDRLQVVSLNDGLATVRAEPRFFHINPTQLNLRLGQVVFSLTQYRSVRRVRFVSRAFAPRRAFTRRSFTRNLPAILVDGPLGADTTHSPLTISGSARVRDGLVGVRVLDAAGAEIARGVAMAACGSGCRVRFRTRVPYAVPRTRNGTIEVFEASATDDGRRNVVAIPVRLAR